MLPNGNAKHLMKCGAKKRNSDERCRAPAMANGRCRIHGGKTPATNQNAVKHGFYSTCYTDEEKELLDQIKIGSLEQELQLAKTQLRRAASVPQYDAVGAPNEHYRPDVIDRLLATVGRLEKQHSEITAEAGDQTPIDGFLLVPYETKSADNSD